MPLTKLKEVEKPKKHIKLIQNSIKFLQREFDKYIKEVKEVPWWYNERAVLGFFISGLTRNSSNLIFQEFSCVKGKSKGAKNKSGRADIWFQYGNREYLAETKLCFTSINTRNDTDSEHEYRWTKDALKQANQYDLKEWSLKKANVFALCFEVIYCKRDSLNNLETTLLNEWCIKNESNKLDFYYMIYLHPNILNKKSYLKHGDYYYPAVAVYGLFNK